MNATMNLQHEYRDIYQYCPKRPQLSPSGAVWCFGDLPTALECEFCPTLPLHFEFHPTHPYLFLTQVICEHKRLIAVGDLYPLEGLINVLSQVKLNTNLV